jgi:ribosome biogenesis GTPase / thiamine phosphate phosphatase
VSTTLPGLIIRSQSGFYKVKTEQGSLVCQLRGRLKQGDRLGDLVAIGDRVQVTPIDEKNGMIEEIEPRQRTLSRMAPTPRGEYEQIIIANPDQAVFVFACAEPLPRLRMLDRFLVIAEKQEIPAIIVANKVDLVGMENAVEIFGHYPQIGYRVIYTSAKTGLGVEDLNNVLAEKLSVLAGPSGAGKSSLLNAIQPGLGLVVDKISQSTGKGKHTTVLREMFPLERGGFVADTPGLKALALWDVEPEELDGYFPELRPLVADCQFSDCTHLHEPGCAVQQAVAQGLVHPERYDSYIRLRSGEEEE